jgi:hypothetical protein
MKWFKNLFWSRWMLIRTIWPYKEGYGTYRKNRLTGERMVLDTGLTKEEAQYSADELNGKFR